MTNENTQFGGFITATGAAKQTNANALGIPWKITHMLIGDAGGDPSQTPDPVPSMLQEELINQVYRAQLNQLRVSPDDENVLIAELILPPNVGGWWIRELALEDEDGDFVATAKPAPSYKPLLVQGSGRTQTVRMHIITNGTANIQLKIDPAVVLATRAYADQVVDDLEERLASDSDDNLGARKLGWRGATTDEFIDAGWFMPNDLDLTGTTDESGKVLAALSLYKRVRLPVGTIKMDVTIPSNCSLFGSGELRWNQNAETWQGLGTLIMGSIRFNNQKCCAAGMMSVDRFIDGGNAVTFTGPDTKHHYVKRINTRANNHGWLIEQLGNDHAGLSGGDIVIEDCNHSMGPNGFAIKARNVTLIRCTASLCDPQAFVVVSDNINGAAIYSRASNVKFIDCGGSANKTTLRVYSRDHFSTNNTNGVLPASNIRWIRGELSGCTEHGAHIGDFYQAVPTRTQIKNEDVIIDGPRAILNGMRAVLITLCDRITVKEATMGGNGGNSNIGFDSEGTRVTGLDVTRGHKTYGPALGAEAGVLTLSNGASVINASHGANLYRTANLSTVFIGAITGGRPGQTLTLSIDDNFTTCTVGGRTIRGAGTVARYTYDSVAATWVCEDSPNATELVAGWASNVLIDFSAPGVTSRFVGLGGTTALIDMNAPAASMAGRQYTLRLSPSNAGGKGITAWGSGFKFSTAVPAPTVIGDNTTTVITFYWSGTHMVATSSVNYAN